MPHNLLKIKEVNLKNNCPICYSTDGLYLTFKQKVVDTKFYKSITSKINNELACKNCNSIVYPEQWTDDIDRVVDYQNKAFTPKKTSTSLKKLSWIVIIIIAIIVSASVFTVIYSKL